MKRRQTIPNLNLILGNRLTLSFATANFPEDYLPYTATYSRNKDPYLVWDSGFNADSNTDGHYHHTSASIDSHSPASLNHYHMQSHNHLYPTCSASSASWPSSKKRRCCGLSCGCCALTVLALVIISALATVVGFSVYLAMITNFHKSPQFTVNGSFKVDSGDNFNLRLINTTSPEFIKKANKYETIIKTAFETSELSDAITKAEVYAFRKGSLIVFFRIYLDRRKTDSLIDSQARDEDNKGFDEVFAVKLIQRDLKDGISNLKITGPNGNEKIIIDIKSIKVINELESTVDQSVNDVKTSGIASNKPMRGKDSKQLSNKSSDSQPKANTSDKNRNTMNITTNSLNITLPSLMKTTTSAQPEPEVRNASTAPTDAETNVSLISSTLSPTTHSSTLMTTHSYNETELTVFATNKPNHKTTDPEVKSTTDGSKSEHKNPFLPFTRRQSTVAVTTPSTMSTNMRITTRSRLRSTTPTPSTTTPLPPPVMSYSSNTQSVQPSSDPSNVLLKRTELKDDGLKVTGLDFSQWKPVVQPAPKPPLKPLPPKPIPPPMQAQPPQPPFFPNQIPHNLRPALRPPSNIIPPQYMANRPHIRVPIPIGIPMREVPRLLDSDDTYPELPQKDIERINSSISRTTVSTTITTPSTTSTTPSPPMTTITPVMTFSISSPKKILTTTTSDPTLVDGFMVPVVSITKPEASLPAPTNKSYIDFNENNRDFRRNKSLDVFDDKSVISADEESDQKWHSIALTSPIYVTEPGVPRLQEVSIGSPVLNLPKPSTNVSQEMVKKLNEIVNSFQSLNQTPNTLEPTLDSNSSPDFPKTKSPFDYYTVINDTLFSPILETIANTTFPFISSIYSSNHKLMPDMSTSDPQRLVPTTTPVPEMEMIAGLPIGVDMYDPSLPQKLIRPMGSSEPFYGERLPKYIPPALYSQFPVNNDILNTGSDNNNSEDIIDEALYDDEIASLNHSAPIDMPNIYSLTTTTTNVSLGSETTTAVSACMDNEFQCTSGECVSARAHCNRRFECRDRSDEDQCTCAQYLKTDRQYKKICDGVIDCEDSSDEIDCSYCNDNYVCAQSHQCIDKSKVCNGENDCPSGDDETECISLVPNNQTLDTTGKYFNSEGALYIRRKGEWAPLCLDALHWANDLDTQRNRRSDDLWKVEDLGKAICRANSYSDLKSVELIALNSEKTNLFFKMGDTNDRTSPSLSMWSSLFEKSECLSKRTTYVKCRNFECGVRPLTNGIRRRIVGGQSASHGSWPWQVALYREGEFQCGGVIIDSQWLLTAAHCFHATRDAYWTARFGILRRGNVFAGPYEQLRRITHVIVHKDYVDKGFINDIALLRLDRPIDYSKHVRPVCMPSEEDDVSKWHRQLCTTVGWGKLFEQGRIFPDTLQEVKLPVISTEECRKRTLFLPLYKITDNMFCAGYDRGGRDACLGDSGGPLMCQKRSGKWFLLGVTSNGDGCGRAGRPGVYTKVAKYKDWIESTINSDLGPEVNRRCDGLRCPLGRCLKRESICNGIIECRDASDEKDCLDFNNRFNKSNETYFKVI